MVQGSDQVQGYKDCPNCLILDPIVVGGEEKRWFLKAPKRSISELILTEKTLKQIKTVFFKIYVTTHISEHLILGAEIMALNTTLHYEN